MRNRFEDIQPAIAETESIMSGNRPGVAGLANAGLVLTGDGSNNKLYGKDADDTLYGLGGNDALQGRGGDDTLYGGDGNDTYYVDDAGDVASEHTAPGTDDGGVDTVRATISFTINDDIERLYLLGTSAISGTGNAQDNRIYGNVSGNSLSGGGGDDALLGGAGNDTLMGGEGNDTYYVEDAGDVTSEETVTGIDDGGVDTVRAAVSYTLSDGIERLYLTGSGALDGTGNDLANRIYGNADDNALLGLGGNDALLGGAGADTLRGGDGNDVYYVDDDGDDVSEHTVAGIDDGGIDTVQATISYALGEDVERLVLTGLAAIDGTGNDMANRISGNAAANTLYGLDGNDSLTGGAGADTMYGGDGDDVYYVDDVGDVASEQTGPGHDDGGTDAVQSTVTYILGGHIERLILAGSGAIDGTGNALANRLYGNDGANRLYGLGGDDSLMGGAGNDTLFGGAGSDTYFVDDAGDVASEQIVPGTDDGGIDTVRASVSHTLGAGIERLNLVGSDDIDGTGNALANNLFGNAGANDLSGLDGDDALNGLGGDDAMTGGAGADRFMFNRTDTTDGTDSDSVLDLDFTSGDKLIFTGFSGINGLIANYNQLARFLYGATVTAGSAPGSAQFTLSGANGHQQIVTISDVSGNGTALQQLQAAVGSLDQLGTGLLPGKTLTYVARFTDSDGNVIQSEGHNGWLSLSTFGVAESNGYVSLAFGEDRAGLSLFDAMTHVAGVGLEVEAYQTLGGVLQLVDQYLFTGSEIIADSTYPGVLSYNLSVGQFEHDHWARDGKGALSGPTEFGWNYATAAPVNLTDNASFLTDGSVAGGQSATLSYLVRFFDSKGQLVATEGSNGWAHIDSYTLNILNDRSLSLAFNDGKLSVALTSALETGAGLRAEIEAYKTTGNGIVKVDDLLFDNVHVTDRAVSGTQAQYLALSFGTFQETHNTLDGDNQVVSTSQSGWNFDTQATATLVDTGDFTISETAVAAPADHILVARFVDSAGNVIASGGTDGWIRLEDFNLRVNPDNFPSPSSPNPADPLIVTMDLTGSDRLSIGLEQQLVTNSGLSFQVESLVMINGQYQLVDEYLFENAQVDFSSATNAAGFAYAFTHTHTTYDAKGTVTSTAITGWDLNAREVTILTNPADFDPLSDEASSHDDTLTYVVRFLDSKGSAIASDAGSSGWISGGTYFALSSNSGPANMTVRMAEDAVLRLVSQNMMLGGNLKMDIEAYRTTSSGLQLVDDYLFASVTPISVEHIGDGTAAVQVQIGQYTHEHTTYDSKGDVTGTDRTGWNLSTDSKTSVSDAGDYAIGGTPSVAVEAPVALTYYARILDAKGTPYGSDGAEGWIALSAFDSGQDHIGATPNGSFQMKFGDDLANLALLQAVMTGNATLKIEVDGFDGTHLVDQMLFEHVAVADFKIHGNETTTTLAYDRFQMSHDTDSKAGISTFGWDLGKNSATTLTSAGAFDTSLAAGGAAHNTTYYVRLVDENGQTLATDNNRAFNQLGAFEMTLVSEEPNPSFSLSFGSDQAFLAAFEALLEQNPLARIEIEGYINSQNGPRIIDEYLFDGVHLYFQSTAGPDVTGSLGFFFEQIQVSHYLGEGKAFHAESSGWDYVNHEPTTLTPPHPDVFS